MKIFPDSLAALVFVESTPEEWCDSLDRAVSSRFLDEQDKHVFFVAPEYGLRLEWRKNKEDDKGVIEVLVNKESMILFKGEEENNYYFLDEPFPVPVGDGTWSVETQSWIMTDVNSVLLCAVAQDMVDNFGPGVEIVLPWKSHVDDTEVQFLFSYLSSDEPFLDALGLMPSSAVEEITERWSSIGSGNYEENAVFAVFAAASRNGIVPPALWENQVSIICN